MDFEVGMSLILCTVVFTAEFVYARAGHSEYRSPFPGPSDKKIGEGSTNISMDCPFPAPIWSINSTLYEPLSLKPPIELSTQGIEISIVERTYNNTKFQCFTSDGPELKVNKSTIGILIVTVTDANNPPRLRPKPEIVLDHRRFNFSSPNITIAWTFKNNQSCSSSLMFTINSSRCKTNSPITNWTTKSSEHTLPLAEFVYYSDSELACFIVSAVDKMQTGCSGVSIPFQVQPKVYSNEISTVYYGEDACLKVPEIPEYQSLYAVWPSDDGTDCICPLCNDEDCILKNCGCFSVTSTPELRLTSTKNIKKYSLCWSNLTTNKTGIYLFFEVMYIQPSSLHLLSRIYGRSYNFMVTVKGRNRTPDEILCEQIAPAVAVTVIIVTVLLSCFVYKLWKIKRHPELQKPERQKLLEGDRNAQCLGQGEQVKIIDIPCTGIGKDKLGVTSQPQNQQALIHLSSQITIPENRDIATKPSVETSTLSDDEPEDTGDQPQPTTDSKETTTTDSAISKRQSQSEKDPHSWLDQVLDFENDGVSKHLGKIAEEMDEWEGSIAEHLGLTKADINAIKTEYHKFKLQTRAALEKWKQKRGSDATYNNLIKVFEEADRKDLADFIKNLA